MSAKARSETAAQRHLRLASISASAHEMPLPPDIKTSARDMARLCKIDPACLFKTLILRTADNVSFVACTPASSEIDRKKLAILLKTKRVDLVPQSEAEQLTGYKAGAISPFGQRRKLKTVLDDSALEHETIYVSGGRFALEIEITPEEFRRATDCLIGAISRPTD